MSAFEIIPGDASSVVLLHVPHASTVIPEHCRDGIVLSDAELVAELAAMTDADTDRIADGAAAQASRRPWIFVNRASRLVVDPERFPDEREAMRKVGMGAVYDRTSDGSVLREPTDEERQALIDEFYTPYSEAFAALVRERLETVGAVTIIDVHSYPKDKLPYEQCDGPRPEVCVGTDEFHTDAALIETATAAMRAAAPTGEVGLDSPFAGCYVPLEQYERNRAVRGVMLEIRRDVVSEHLDELAAATAALIDELEAARGI